MTRTNTTLLIVLIAAVILVGGGIIYSLNSADNSEDTNQQTSQTGEDSPQDSQADTSSDEQPSTRTRPDSQVVEGVEIPGDVLTQIERDYPDYIIDDADREVKNGEVYYEIELEHRTPGNDSEYELTFNEKWELIDTEFDRD